MEIPLLIVELNHTPYQEVNWSVSRSPFALICFQLIDILATIQVLQNLQPSREEMETPKGKKLWLDKVLSVKPVIERVCLSEGDGSSREEMRSRRQESLTETR